MSMNEEALGPSTDSFWDIDGYKNAVKRQEDGAKLCSDLVALIDARATIEREYAKSLTAWNKKWMQTIEKGPEYGTTQAAWKSVLVEAESISLIHSDVKDQLLNEVALKIKEWKQANFKKSVPGQKCKETKQLEEEFKKAQKPWAKKYSKVKEARKQYHNACKMEKSYTQQENNAKADSGVSQDSISMASVETSGVSDPNKRLRKLKKIQDKAEKCRKDVDVSRQKYESALTDLNSYNPKYMEDMTLVYDRSDSNEEKRLVFFKEMLFGIHKCLDISQNVKLPQIYAQLHHTIDQADYVKDLKWWSQGHGKDMGMAWPQFEDYQEGHHAISRKEKTKSQHITSDGIMLTGVKSEQVPPPAYNTVAANGSTGSEHVTPPQASPNVQSQNPFGDDDFDDDEQVDPSNGIPVKAIYDYVGQEEDELSFKEGEVFLKLKDKDEQGWCTGLKDGRVGLYPDNYVQPI